MKIRIIIEKSAFENIPNCREWKKGEIITDINIKADFIDIDDAIKYLRQIKGNFSNISRLKINDSI